MFKFCMKYIHVHVHVHPYNVHAASLLDLSVDVNPVDSAVDQRLRLQLLPVQVVYHAVYTVHVYSCKSQRVFMSNERTQSDDSIR